MKNRLHDKKAGIAILVALIIISLAEIIFRAVAMGEAVLTTSNLGEQLAVIALAVTILIGFEFNSNTVAVILTILGYSINNTIVIYDRIRENRTLMPKASQNELINMGCSQSLTRSIRTSITTVFTMVVITVVALVQGYTSLLTFSVPLMAGLISGTYSSLFVAPVTWSWLVGRKNKKASNKD